MPIIRSRRPMYFHYKFLFEENLSYLTFYLLSFILSELGEDKEIQLSLNYIQKKTKISRVGLSKAKNELIDKGLITCVNKCDKEQGNHPTIFKINF